MIIQAFLMYDDEAKIQEYKFKYYIKNKTNN